jgi:aryl-alcohol dehydrogenase-like predicted oxidoreductase
VEKLSFLSDATGRTIGQAAIQFALASPNVVSVLPNVYSRDQLIEFAAAPDTPPLTSEELSRIADLYVGAPSAVSEVARLVDS